MTTPLAAALQRALGGPWTVQALGASGFCSTWRATGNAQLFVKTLPAADAARLDAEADGLRALAAQGGVAVPAVAHCGVDDGTGMSLLAMQWLDLRPPDGGFGQRLGEALGALHVARPKGDGCFGWARDNYLGGTLQRNRWSTRGGLSGWLAFYRSERLEALVPRLQSAGAPAELLHAVGAVAAALPRFFEDGHVPRASLIHGDLWSGNWGMRKDGKPVVFDPAVSVSDAEAELAMVELFGTPPVGFWPAWQAVMGAHAGYARRRGLYQLYHLLNHALLFGGAYFGQATMLAQRLLR
ncbi:MAG TPA: fructosamine kinase family protein [Ideonella sp.]|uniref:fructosamine kinase family protein n=1 Tax=Ideonella sp. TaxID=1929293 RepID=UPI002E326D9F|nr:fructosamine kinase family protein [Ideonella sp.]HEX5686978.1 fructosamine kinase family protein [Ideonella sp.]